VKKGKAVPTHFGKGELNSPDLTLVSETVLSGELDVSAMQFRECRVPATPDCPAEES
jgi:hypothetical protein